MSDAFDEEEIFEADAVDLGPLLRFPGYLFRRAQSKAYLGLYPVLAPFSVRPTQLAVLMLLKYNPGIKPSVVAATLGLQRTNFAPLLQELRQRGFADSRFGTEDKRTRALFLTPQGEELVKNAETATVAYEEEIRAAIDPEDSGVMDKIAGWLLGGSDQ